MIKISLPFSELDPNTIQIPDKNSSNISGSNVVMVKYPNNGVILVYDLSDWLDIAISLASCLNRAPIVYTTDTKTQTINQSPLLISMLLYLMLNVYTYNLFF